MLLRPIKAAEVAYEADRVLEQVLGLEVRPPWRDVSDAVHQSVVTAMMLYLEGAPASVAHAHRHWVKAMREDGWRLGSRDDAERTHPMLKPWGQLSPDERLKARLFHAVVTSLLHP